MQASQNIRHVLQNVNNAGKGLHMVVSEDEYAAAEQAAVAAQAAEANKKDSHMFHILMQAFVKPSRLPEA